MDIVLSIDGHVTAAKQDDKVTARAFSEPLPSALMLGDDAGVQADERGRFVLPSQASHHLDVVDLAEGAFAWSLSGLGFAIGGIRSRYVVLRHAVGTMALVPPGAPGYSG